MNLKRVCGREKYSTLAFGKDFKAAGVSFLFSQKVIFWSVLRFCKYWIISFVSFAINFLFEKKSSIKISLFEAKKESEEKARISSDSDKESPGKITGSSEFFRSSMYACLDFALSSP